MAIEIRIESTWETDDGEGRRVEVTVIERRHPAEDPLEHTRYFASGEVEELKRYLSDLLDRKASLFVDSGMRECRKCRRVEKTEHLSSELVCERCRGLAG